MLKIGVTGPIGCGKSTVARWLGERAGVRVVDADHEARLVLAPGTAEVEAAYARFGGALRRPNGELDRAALGRIVFADPVALRDLEAIVHPAVRPRILAEIADAESAGATAVIIEAIKLVEGGLANACDEVWLLTCSPRAQHERLIRRGSTPADAAQRIAAQGDIVRRIRGMVGRVIDSSSDPTTTRQDVERAMEDALQAARP